MLYLRGEGRFPHRAELAGREGTVERIEVPMAVSVSGRVTVDDRAPGEPLAIRMTPDRGSLFPEALPTEVRGWIGIEARGELGDREPLLLPVDEGGRFALRGVPDGLEVHLLPIGERLFLLDPGATGLSRLRNALTVTAPANDLLLPCLGATYVTGRALSRSGGYPLGGFSASGTFEYQDGGRSRSTGRVDEDGTFTLERAPSSLARVVIRIHHDEFEVLGSAIGEGGWLGELLVGDTGRATVHVVDREGRPIAEAKLSAGRIATTGADGAYRFRSLVEGEETTLTVTARGFREGKVTLTASAIAEVHETVVLEASNRLAVRVVPWEEEAGLVVALERGVLADPSRIDGNAWGLRNDAPDTLMFHPNEGLVEVRDLRPGIPIEVRVLDAFENVLCTASVPPLTEQETREVEVEVGGKPVAFSGVVRTSGGAPIEGATVVVEAPGAGWESLESDGDGEFTVSHYFGREASLRAEADGFSPAELRGVAVHEGSRFELVLEEVRRLPLLLETEDGEPLSPQALVRYRDRYGREQLALASEPGLWHADLPDAGEVLLQVDLGPRRVLRSARLQDGAAMCHVPPWGSLSVASLSPEGPARELTDEEARRILAYLSPGQAGSAAAALGIVLEAPDGASGPRVRTRPSPWSLGQVATFAGEVRVVRWWVDWGRSEAVAGRLLGALVEETARVTPGEETVIPQAR